MNKADLAALMKGVAPVIGELIASNMRPIADEVLSLRKEIAELRAVDHTKAISDAVAEAVAAIPAPKDGKDGIDGKDGLPGKDGGDGKDGENGKDGRDGVDGKDADPAEIERLVNETVERVLAGWGKPQDGKSVTVEDVEPLLAELVSRATAEAVAAIPKPKDGAAGKLPVVKAWEDRVYYEGECATFEGSTYQALRDTGRSPQHDDWACIAAAGAPGKNADEIEVRGTYESGTSYKRLNIVALNGAAFMAKADDPGPCPGDGWQVIAMRGKAGPPGEARKGEPGARGLPGTPVVHIGVDDQGMMTLVNGDGSTVECDLYPLLSKVGA